MPFLRRHPLAYDLLFTFYWFAKNTENTALNVVLVPKVVLLIVGASHSGGWLSAVSVGSSIIGALAFPVMGHLSDRTRSRFGRRRPFMVVGVLLSFIFLHGTLFSHTVFWLGLSVLILQVVHAMASIPYEGLMADTVPHGRIGYVTGLLGMMSRVANLVGVVLATFLSLTVVFEALIVLQILGLVTTLAAVRKERPSSTLSSPTPFFEGLWISPRHHGQWWWVWLSRVAAMTGFAIVYTYLFYYLKFVERLANPGTAIDILLIVVTLGAVLANLVAGPLSDRMAARKWITLAGSLVMALSAVGFALAGGMLAAYVVSGLFGIGYGMYQGTERALLIDVQPGEREAAKSFGLWQVSYNLGVLLGSLVGGLMISGLLKEHSLALTYRGLYLSSMLFFVVGALTLLRVKPRVFTPPLAEQPSGAAV